MTGAVGDVRGGWAIWFVAAAGAIAYASVFYPGAMSFDSAYQWWQARGGESTNIQGIGMIWLWRADNALAPGPGAIFMLQLLLFWGGMALIAQHLSAPTPMRLAFMLVVAAAPVCFVLLSHVWSDVMLMCVLTCAVAAMLLARGHRRRWLAPAYALLFLAVTLRHNAAAAVFPLLVYMEHLRTADAGRAAGKPIRTIGIALLVAFIFQFATAMLERAVDQPRTMFAATAQWDLAAISLDVGEILLPSKTHGPGLTLDDLRQAFEPFTNTSLFARTRAGMMQPYLAPADPLNGEIRRAWIEAVLAHPREYLAHRWRLTRALFGSKSRDWPYGLVYFDGAFQFDGNPPVTPNTTDAHAWCLRLFDAMRDSVVLSTWPYLGLGLVALALAWRRRHRADMEPAFAVLISGVLYAAPLPFVAPAAEMRYTGWVCLATLLGTALVLAPPRLLRPRAQPHIFAS
jgi:hypothetical protein